jgi:probable rRNA maturation factor
MPGPETSADGVEVDLSISDSRWHGADADVGGLVERAVAAALAVAPGRPPGPLEICVVLSDDAALRDLNRTWRGKDRPTNVLSFPAAGAHGGHGPRLIGDVVLAYETMLRESAAETKPLKDHLAHLVVHGTLHLLGEDHETGDDEARAMERLEIAALARLGVPDPYGDEAAV